jgi:hypothetical protein
MLERHCIRAPLLVGDIAVVRQAVWPPSMTMACPTMKAAASEQSQRTADSISSRFPIRPTGSHAIIRARPSSVLPLNRSIIGVSMMPGQIAFTLMFDAA